MADQSIVERVDEIQNSIGLSYERLCSLRDLLHSVVQPHLECSEETGDAWGRYLTLDDAMGRVLKDVDEAAEALGPIHHELRQRDS